MVGSWSRWVTILLLLMITQNSLSDCWETCIGPRERGFYGNEYDKLYNDLILRFNSVLKLDSRTGGGTSNGTVLLMDSALPANVNRKTGEVAFNLQKRLTQILAYTLPLTTSYNPGFFVKYEHDRARTCDGWQCLGRCDMVEVIDNEFQLEEDTKDHIDDMLHNACQLAHEFGSMSTCVGSTKNLMAVAVVNSQFQTPKTGFDDMDNDMELGSLDIINEINRDDLAPLFDDIEDEFTDHCANNFPKRAILGTLDASATIIDTFPSASTRDWGGYARIEDTYSMLAAAEQIEKCMRKSCCGTTTTANRQTYDAGICTEMKNGKPLTMDGAKD